MNNLLQNLRANKSAQHNFFGKFAQKNFTGRTGAEAANASLNALHPRVVEGNSMYYRPQAADIIYAGNGTPFDPESILQNNTIDIKMVNGAASEKTVYLFGGIIKTTGLLTDGTVDEVTTSATFGPATQSGALAKLQAYMKQYPFSFTGARITYDTEAQMTKKLEFTEDELTKSDVLTSLDFSESTLITPQWEAKVREVKKGFIIGPRTTVKYTLVASETVTLRLYLGAQLRPERALVQHGRKQGSFIH